MYAVHVNERALDATDDHVIWTYARANDFVVVTTNAKHFLPLLNTDLHPGLIVLREGSLSREEQWLRLNEALDYLFAQPEPPASFMINKVLELEGRGSLVVREIPPP